MHPDHLGATQLNVMNGMGGKIWQVKERPSCIDALGIGRYRLTEQTHSTIDIQVVRLGGITNGLRKFCKLV